MHFQSWDLHLHYHLFLQLRLLSINIAQTDLVNMNKSLLSTAQKCLFWILPELDIRSADSDESTCWSDSHFVLLLRVSKHPDPPIRSEESCWPMVSSFVFEFDVGQQMCLLFGGIAAQDALELRLLATLPALVIEEGALQLVLATAGFTLHRFLRRWMLRGLSGGCCRLLSVEGGGEVGQCDAALSAESTGLQRECRMIPGENVLVVVLETEAERRVAESCNEIVRSWGQVVLCGGDIGSGQSVLQQLLLVLHVFFHIC